MGLRTRLRRSATVTAAAATITIAVTGAAQAAFRALTSNASNSIASGTVAISDNDAGAALFSMDSVLPGASTTRCFRLTYSGSLPATIRHYATVAGSLAAKISITVTRGSGASTFGSCSGFTADATNYLGSGAGVIFNNKLSTYPGDYSSGLVDPTPGSPETWTSGETHDYKIQATIDPTATEGLSSTATFRWEARNQ